MSPETACSQKTHVSSAIGEGGIPTNAIRGVGFGSGDVGGMGHHQVQHERMRRILAWACWGWGWVRGLG